MNKFSILHISDLHRKTEGISNRSLIFALKKDIESLTTIGVAPPELCIVTGDLVQGSKKEDNNAINEIRRQYELTADLLLQIAEQLLNRPKGHIVILPGNHDVCLKLAKESFTQFTIPHNEDARKKLYYDSQNPSNFIRLCPVNLCYYKADILKYETRFNIFVEFYNKFYDGERSYKCTRKDQYSIFEYCDLGVLIGTLNSAVGIDNFNVKPHIDKTAVIELCQELDKSQYKNFIKIVGWHHNLKTSLSNIDSLNPEFTKYLKLVNVSFGVHGHQHSAEISLVDDIYWQHDPFHVISAGSLCADDKDLSYMSPRGYNIIELDIEEATAKVYFRKMDKSHDFPIFSEYIFNDTDMPFKEFKIQKIDSRALTKTLRNRLYEEIANLMHEGNYRKIISLIQSKADIDGLQAPLTNALIEIDDPQLTLKIINNPVNLSQAMVVAKSIIEIGDKKKAISFMNNEFVKSNLSALSPLTNQIEGLINGK